MVWLRRLKCPLRLWERACWRPRTVLYFNLFINTDPTHRARWGTCQMVPGYTPHTAPLAAKPRSFVRTCLEHVWSARRVRYMPLSAGTGDRLRTVIRRGRTVGVTSASPTGRPTGAKHALAVAEYVLAHMVKATEVVVCGGWGCETWGVPSRNDVRCGWRAMSERVVRAGHIIACTWCCRESERARVSLGTVLGTWRGAGLWPLPCVRARRSGGKPGARRRGRVARKNLLLFSSTVAITVRACAHVCTSHRLRVLLVGSGRCGGMCPGTLVRGLRRRS